MKFAQPQNEIMAKKTLATIKAEFDAERASIIHQCAFECSKLRAEVLKLAAMHADEPLEQMKHMFAAKHYGDCADAIRELLGKKE